MGEITESEQVELKRSTAELKEAIISMVAILNKHKKGTLYFGITNNGVIVGQHASEATLREISQTIANNIEPKVYPEVRTETMNAKTCVKVTFEGHEQPYFAYGRAYMRVADEDKRLSAKELENMIVKKNKDKIAWDTDICKRAQLFDIDKKKIQHFLAISGRQFDTLKNTLEKTGLVKEDKITNAAILLFGKRPTDLFLQARLRCAVFSTPETLIDMQDFEDDIFSLIDCAEKYILKNIHIGMKLEGLRRVDVPEINKEAFREAIINAFCHRDYWSLDSVDIAIFKNRVEIKSPGLLISGLTIKDIQTKQVSERRNELIAKTLKEADLVESWGTGIRKMRTLEPKMRLEEVGSHFITTFMRKEEETLKEGIDEKVTEEVTEEVTENQQKILDHMRINAVITVKEISVSIGVSERKIKKNIAKLKTKGLLERIGPDKGGHWKVK